MIRRILVPLDPSPFATASLEFACFVAKHTKSRLTGMTVLDIPGIEKSIGTIPLGGIYYAQHLFETHKQEAITHTEVLVKNFQERCDKDSIPYKLSDYQGSLSERMMEVSIYFDLVVVGLRTYFNFSTDAQTGISIEDILKRTVTPIVAMPDHFEPPTKELRVLIAFDASLPAARSLHAFAQFADMAKFDVEILMAHENKEYALHNLERAHRYLDAHGIKKVTTHWSQLDIIDAVEGEYIDNIDAVVLGVHSNKGLFDFMVGSLSRHLIERKDKILVLAQ